MAYVVIRLTGSVHIKTDIGKTLNLLRLNKKNHCVVVPETKEIVGMIKKVKNAITWGELDEATIVKLILKRGRLPGNKRITEEYVKEKTGKTTDILAKEITQGSTKLKEIPGLKPVFRLNPPSKGLERKGLKKEFSMGGSWGYRGVKINELLKRMI